LEKTKKELNPLEKQCVYKEAEAIDIHGFTTLSSIRQLATGELTTDDLEAFLRLGFTHHYEIVLSTSSTAERLFYIRKCAGEYWSVETLKYHLRSKLFRKQGKMPNNFDKTLRDAAFKSKALETFKDEYLWDFVNIADADDEPDERVIERAAVLNIKKTIMSLGKDFSFLGEQYRVEVEGDEYFIDLLFFNRRLRSLVALEIKRGAFKPEYAGKMNFYLSALDEYVRLKDENPSVGIILCKTQKNKVVEFAFRDTSKPMGVATYKLSDKLPAQYRGILPDPETLKQLL